MRKLAMCFIVFLMVVPAQSGIPPQPQPLGLWPDIENDYFRREEIKFHWQMAAGLAAFNSADKQGMADWQRLENMPLVAADASSIHPLRNQIGGGTAFMVVLPEDLQYFNPEARRVLEQTTVGYLRPLDILVVTEDVDPKDWRMGFHMLIYAMESALPRDLASKQSPELATWEIQTEARLRKELAGD